MVSKIVFGRGSFSQLGEILEPKRLNRNAPFIRISRINHDVFANVSNSIQFFENIGFGY